MIEQILHLAFSIDNMLGDFLILFWAEMRFSRLLDILFINLATHLVHLNLLIQNLANRMLLLLPLQIAGHLESIVLLL